MPGFFSNLHVKIALTEYFLWMEFDLTYPWEILWKFEKIMSNSDFRHNLVDLSQIFYESSNIQPKIGFIYKHHIFINIAKFLWWREIIK